MEPDASAAVVRLIEPAFDDLKALYRKDPQIVRWALKKMLLLERNPEADEELRGVLIGWRKIVVGDRDWRIVWRVTFDDTGSPVVDVAEVWAVGARADSEVYAEMNERVARLGSAPPTIALASVIEKLGRAVADIQARSQIPPVELAPTWLVDRLVHTAGFSREAAEKMSVEDAASAWEAWFSKPH